MKRNYMALMLVIGLLLSLCACGKTESSVASVPAETSEPQAFGDVSLEDIPALEAQTTSLPEGSAAEPADSAQEPAAPPAAAQDFTEAAVIAAIICDGVDMLPYAPEDPMYLWRSVGYCIGQVGTAADLVTMEDVFGKVSPDAALIFAWAMDADFSGEMPSVTEEDPLIAMAEDGGYLINMLSQGNLELQMTENRYNAGGETVIEEAELFRDGESIGTYTVTLTPYTGPAEGAQYFSCSISHISSQ